MATTTKNTTKKTDSKATQGVAKETAKQASNQQKEQPEQPKQASNQQKMVYFDEINHSMIYRDYKDSCGVLQSVIEKYKDLDVGEPDEKVLRAVINESSLAAVKNAYYKKMHEDIDQTSKNKLLAGKLKEMLDEPITNWIEKAREAREAVIKRFNNGSSIPKRLHWEYFYLYDGKVVFDEQALKDEYSVFLDSENRKYFFELAQQTVENLNKLQKMTKESNPGAIPPNVMYGSISTEYLITFGDKGEIQLNPEFIEFIH